ncbi:hypothetical protein G4B88_026456 [Cannabis sativa]|uniref:Ubiquitin-like protease family profile domain-containing protein n=1 Tax=Cannabis sativa TaxID=3483 RepID=A0A7J6GWQ8_CANSA|nr:hypothetical protein G4B88_026456 [Cannabis sativa]
MSDSPKGSYYKTVKYISRLCLLDERIGKPVDSTLEVEFNVWLGHDLLKTTNFYLKSKDKLTKENTTSDCGIFLAAFAEYFIDNKPILSEDFIIEVYRDRLAVKNIDSESKFT